MAVYAEHGPKHPDPRPQQDFRVPEALPAGRLLRNTSPPDPTRPLAQSHRGPDPVDPRAALRGGTTHRHD